MSPAATARGSGRRQPDAPFAAAALDALDHRILRAAQGGLALERRPYAALARAVGAGEAEVIERLRALLDAGIVRRIAAVPNHYALGYRANGMSVWDVADEAVDACGERLGALDEISHCYRRPRHLPHWPYNLFAMVHAHTRDEVEARIEIMARMLGEHCRARDVLYSTEVLKKTGVRLPPSSPTHCPRSPFEGAPPGAGG